MHQLFIPTPLVLEVAPTIVEANPIIVYNKPSDLGVMFIIGATMMVDE